MSGSQDDATWRCTVKHARALGQELQKSATRQCQVRKSRAIPPYGNPPQASAMSRGTVLCPACPTSCHFAEDSRGRLLSCTTVGAHWQPQFLSRCITHAHDIVTKYLARNEHARTFVGRLAPQQFPYSLQLRTMQSAISALWPHSVRVHLGNMLTFFCGNIV